MSKTKIDDLNELAAKGDMFVRTYSPSDGITRYRFFHMQDIIDSLDIDDEHQSYFGPKSGIYTALGIQEAIAFATGASMRKFRV